MRKRYQDGALVKIIFIHVDGRPDSYTQSPARATPRQL